MNQIHKEWIDSEGNLRTHRSRRRITEKASVAPPVKACWSRCDREVAVTSPLRAIVCLSTFERGGWCLPISDQPSSCPGQQTKPSLKEGPPIYPSVREER